MSIHLEIGSAVPTYTPKNVYEIEASYMHGDANAYSTESWTFDTVDEMILTLEGLAFMKRTAKCYGNRDDNTEKLRDFFETLGADPEGEEVENFLEDWQQPDTTDESYDCDAMLQSFAVYFYDENGVKFNVNVTITVPLKTTEES